MTPPHPQKSASPRLAGVLRKFCEKSNDPYSSVRGPNSPNHLGEWGARREPLLVVAKSLDHVYRITVRAAARCEAVWGPDHVVAIRPSTSRPGTRGRPSAYRPCPCRSSSHHAPPTRPCAGGVSEADQSRPWLRQDHPWFRCAPA